MPEQADTVRLLLDIAVQRGTVEWSLRDPTGEVRHEGRVETGGALEREPVFDSIAGEWTLSVEFQQMTGEYEFRLRATW